MNGTDQEPIKVEMPEEDISMSLLTPGSSTVCHPEDNIAYTALCKDGQLILRITKEDGTHEDEVIIDEGCAADNFNILLSDKGLNIIATETGKKILFVSMTKDTHQAVETDTAGPIIRHILPIDYKTDDKTGAKLTRYIMIADTADDTGNCEASCLIVETNNGKVTISEGSSSFIITMNENTKIYTIMMVQFGDMTIPAILARLSDASDASNVSNTMITIPNIEKMEHQTIAIDGIDQFDDVRKMFNMETLNVVEVPTDDHDGEETIKEESDDTEDQ